MLDFLHVVPPCLSPDPSLHHRYPLRPSASVNFPFTRLPFQVKFVLLGKK